MSADPFFPAINLLFGMHIREKEPCSHCVIGLNFIAETLNTREALHS